MKGTNEHIERRKLKANMIISTLKKVYDKNQYEGVEIDVLVSMLCLEFGAGRRYAKEIIKDLINVKKISVVDKKAFFISDELEKPKEIPTRDLTEKETNELYKDGVSINKGKSVTEILA